MRLGCQTDVAMVAHVQGAKRVLWKGAEASSEEKVRQSSLALFDELPKPRRGLTKDGEMPLSWRQHCKTDYRTRLNCDAPLCKCCAKSHAEVGAYSHRQL